MKHKVSELEGALLDAAVAQAEGERVAIRDGEAVHPGDLSPYTYSTRWASGGPIIERERITLTDAAGAHWTGMVAATWGYDGPASDHEGTGRSPLVAAMRAYVTSKFGEEVEILDSR